MDRLLNLAEFLFRDARNIYFSGKPLWKPNVYLCINVISPTLRTTMHRAAHRSAFHMYSIALTFHYKLDKSIAEVGLNI